MTEVSELANVWYLCDNGNKGGFTSDPDQAVKDLTGAPIIAPGHVRKIVELVERRHNRQLNVQRKAVDEIWTALLDGMEQKIKLTDEFTGTDPQDKPRLMNLATRLSLQAQENNGLAIALAILELGHDYKEAPKETLRKIHTMAQLRYDKESEDA